MAHLENVFRYVYSSSLDERIQIKIGTLEGVVPKPSYEQLLADPLIRFSGICSEPVPSLKVVLKVYNNGKLLGLPVNTTHKAFVKRFNWNEWVTLPIQFSDLPRTAVLAITILDCAGGGARTTIVGGTSIPFFGKKGLYRQGMYDLRVWPQREADGHFPTQTPGKTKASTSEHQMQRLAKLSKKHHNGQMPKVDWLDRLTFREIEVINEREKTESDHMYLLVEFQSVQCGDDTYSIVYFEPDGDQKYRQISKPKLVTIPDSEILQDNLVEKKHHRLSRSARSDALDRELKPNAHDRDNLHKIVHVNPPNYVPTSEEQDLIWKFRFHLSTDKQALVIFLRCINWETPSEVQQALNLLKLWNPLDGCDALALLTPDFSQPELRRYAVERLQQSGDEVLQLYMLQLVQALKYENLEEFEQYADRMLPAESVDVIQSIDLEHLDSLSQSAMSECCNAASMRSSRTSTSHLAADLTYGSDSTSGTGHMSESEHGFDTPSRQRRQQRRRSTGDPSGVRSAASRHTPAAIDASAVTDGSESPPPPNEYDLDGLESAMADSAGPSETANQPHIAISASTASSVASTASSALPVPPFALYTFLIDRAGRNPALANYLYWYLSTECESNDEAVRKPDVRIQRMYEKMLKLLKRSLDTGDPGRRQIKVMLDRQQLFVDELVRLVKLVAKESGGRLRKLERFQQLLADPERFRITFTAFEPMPFPLDPSVLITGIRPAETVLFKSALMPAQLTFTTASGRDYVAIFKYGDDLRQDQLVMQIIHLMDRMMRNENMDLKLTPYRVLATGIKHGFLQFVPSITLAEVCAVHGSICKYFAKAHALPDRSVSVEALDNYTRSLAGYCVITYLLGVGDRHLDNLLLTYDGQLFHIDFGYILGRDPKPMPPPMKLSKDMVEAMGGITSEHFRNFAKHIFTAYLYLRRQATLTLNLFALMVDASIPDIALEPDKAVRKVEHHLRLDLTEEEAIMHLQRVIESSVSAVVPGMLDQMHKIAQYLRR